MTKKIFHLCILTSQDQIFMFWHNERKQWEFPGGKHDVGETMLESIKRELVEEIGLHCEPSLIGVTDYDNKWVMGVWRFETKKTEIKCMEGKHSNPKWFHISQLPELCDKTKLALNFAIGAR